MSYADQFVYWLYNAEGECIYVGCTFDPERRWHEHYRRLGDEIVTRRVRGPFPRRDAFALERAEQKRLNPKYNGRLQKMPFLYSTDGRDCISTPDEDVIRAAANLFVERWHLKHQGATS